MSISALAFCLAIATFNEAKGEPLQGQKEVAQTIYNRAKGESKNLCKVINAPGQFTNLSKSKQKSYFKRLSKKKDDTFEIIKSISIKIIEQGKTTRTTHFHSTHVRPSWSHDKHFKKVRKIGNHIFYASLDHDAKYF